MLILFVANDLPNISIVGFVYPSCTFPEAHFTIGGCLGKIEIKLVSPLVEIFYGSLEFPPGSCNKESANTKSRDP